MCVSWFFYTVFQGVQPNFGQCLKGQVGFFQVVKAGLRFFLDQHPLDLCVDRTVNIAPLNFAFRCACLDVPAFPPVILAFANIFSPVAPFLFPPTAWTPIWPLILSTFVFSWIFHTELGNVQKTFSFCEVFSKVIWDTFARNSIDSQI